VEAVFFDVGETLVDETEVWGGWADWLGVPRLTFFAALGAVVARGGDQRDVFTLVDPARDFDAAARARGTAEPGFELRSLYPDAVPCLRALHERGYRVGIAANQPAHAADVLGAAGLPVEWLLLSGSEGVEKPDPAFFQLLCARSGLPPAAIAYVGDRVDNDVLPALAAGMAAVHVRRGPWGVIQAGWPGAENASVRLDSLAELAELAEPPDRLGALGVEGRPPA
jgi:FMN phosphatase YigB (HAD superfamily)